MDLRLLYSDFVMDDRGVVFHSTSDSSSSFHDDLDNTYCAVAAFQHGDPDLARDPLSTNRRLHDTSDLEMSFVVFIRVERQWSPGADPQL